MSVTRRHTMPFGAEPQGNGQWRFRLWAPAAKAVDLRLFDTTGKERRLAMVPGEEGWFETEANADAGNRYLYCIDGGMCVPDPASRFQPEDIHGPSELIDPMAWPWQDQTWPGRPWEEAVIYELHVGTFTAGGTFAAAAERLEALASLGVTAVELMPLGDFPGQRNWGYDGVFHFAPESRYGHPDDLKAFVEKAHSLGLMVFLDVVYNHFGPEGNYLHLYAPQFFTEHHHTPWGAAINYDGPGNHWVREFFIHNALYWLEEYHLDGLRFDAVHAILDDSQPNILIELADRVRSLFKNQRPIHLVLENDLNAAHFLERDEGGVRWYDAQWNDDIHHAFHVILTGEETGYYQDYRERPIVHLGRALAEGFSYQGEHSVYRHGERRGDVSSGLPPQAFVSFLQNHDQVGNRACGDRISTLTSPEILRAATSIFLMAPSPPLIFMGQEWGSRRPFPFFCDFGKELGEKVTEGRRKEFEKFPQFSDPAARASIPDPQLEETQAAAVLDWKERERGEYAEWLALHRELLVVRRTEILPLLLDASGHAGRFALFADGGLAVRWRFPKGILLLVANLGSEPVSDLERPAGRLIHATPGAVDADWDTGTLGGWSVSWFLVSEENEKTSPLRVSGKNILT